MENSQKNVENFTYGCYRNNHGILKGMLKDLCKKNKKKKTNENLNEMEYGYGGKYSRKLNSHSCKI